MKDTKAMERIGVNACGLLFEKNGFVFREQSIADYGIDAIIETKDESYPTGKMIAVQIKSGESFFTERVGNDVIFRIDEKHRNYWINHALPVIIVLYSPSKDNCIWAIVNNQTLVHCKKGWKIRIPVNQTVNNSSLKLREIASNMSIYEHRHASLVLAKEWMLEARKQGHLILEVEEWVNKLSGRGRFTLKSANEEKILFDHELFGFGLKVYDQVIQEMFPWANVEIDQEFYEENYENGDDGNWDNYDEYDDSIQVIKEIPQNGIYPYRNAIGEVDFYRLVLTLNEIGRAFLLTENFLEDGKFYCIDPLEA